MHVTFIPVDSDVVTYDDDSDDDSDYGSGDDVEVIDSDTDDEDYAEIVPVIKKRKVRALSTSLNPSSLLCHSSYFVTYLRDSFDDEFLL
jgi:hypothetical protein